MCVYIYVGGGGCGWGVCVCMYMFVCICVCMCMCMRVCMCVCMCVYVCPHVDGMLCMHLDYSNMSIPLFPCTVFYLNTRNSKNLESYII